MIKYKFLLMACLIGFISTPALCDDDDMDEQTPGRKPPAPSYVLSPEAQQAFCQVLCTAATVATVATVALAYTFYKNCREGRQDLTDYWKGIMGNVGP